MTKLIKNTQMLIQPNQLIQAHYNLNLMQKHVILMCLGILNTQKVNNSAAGVTFDIRDLYELSASKYRIDKYVEQVKKTIKNLHKSVLTIQHTKTKFSDYSWISQADYDSQTSIVTVHLDEKILKMFSEIKGNYTQCLLKNTLNISNFYAIRIYELVMQYKNQNYIDVPIMYITDLRLMLGIENKYKNFRDLMRDVLTPAVDEINKKTEITIDFHCTGPSHAYTEIQFIYEFKTKESEQILLPKTKTTKPKTKRKLSIKDASSASFSPPVYS